VGHSDFSHSITGDFTSRLIRPATQLRRAGPYEISRGNTENFPTAPPAHTLLCPDAPSISFAPIVQARHHLDRADRFASFGYGSVFRLRPFRPHLTVSALSCADSQQDTPAHGHRTPPPNDAQRGVTPAFGYGPRLGPVRLDFHQLVLCAARRTLRPPPTPTRLTTPFPVWPVIGRVAPAADSQGRRAGEGLPSSRRHCLDVPRPIRRGVPDGCASRLFTASMAFTVISAARLPLLPPSQAGPLTTLQASLHATDRPVAPPYRAFDAALRHRPFPDDAGSLLPGPLAATRTGLPPASDDELTTISNALRRHLQSAGRTKFEGYSKPQASEKKNNPRAASYASRYVRYGPAIVDVEDPPRLEMCDEPFDGPGTMI
jgi:hypothetical protein